MRPPTRMARSTASSARLRPTPSRPRRREVAPQSGVLLSTLSPAPKYIWDLALDNAGNLFVATGDNGQIFRVTAKATSSVFFKSDEAHIRVLALDNQGNLIAGSDGSGLIYRISPNGEAFVLYSAPKKEITALTIDKSGNIYAAGVGEKHSAAGTSAAPTTPIIMMVPGGTAEGKIRLQPARVAQLPVSQSC